MRRLAPVLLALLSTVFLCPLATGGESGTGADTPLPIYLPSGHYATGTPQEQAAQLVDELAPVLHDRRIKSAADFREATWRIREALRAAPNDLRTQWVYGWLLIEQVRYAEAAEAFRKMLAVHPQDRQAQAGLAEARRLSLLLRSLPLHLKSGWQVLLLAEVPRSARPGVVVLVGQPDPIPAGSIRGQPEVDSPELRYFAWAEHGYRETFRTRRLADSTSRDPWSLQFARLWVGDFQHIGRPQVLLVSGDFTGGETLTYADIFETRRGTMRPVLHVESDAPQEWVDLNRNQRLEVQAPRLVGPDRVDLERGVWYDLYQYDGQRYVRANSHFRAFGRKQLNDMLDLAKRFPGNSEVLASVAQAYRDLGEPAKARPYERQAREAGQREAGKLVDELAPVLHDRRMESADQLYTAFWQIDEALRAAPEEPRVQRLYGWLLIEQVRYEEAAQAFRKALAVNPRDQQARAGLAEARRLSLLLRSLPLHLTSGWRAYRLAEVPAHARPGVFVLIGRPHLSLRGPSGREAYLWMEVRYFAWEKRGYRETFRTLRLAGAEPGERAQALFARLWVGDFQHTGRPQVLLVSGELAGDSEPTYVDIFEVQRGTVRPVLHVDGEIPQQWVNLDHNQRPEVQTLHTIGSTIGGVDRGAWYDVYQYDGRRYVRANGHFPAFSRKQLDDLLHLNEQFPDDSEVLAHIAQAYRDLGEPAKARPYERQAREAEKREEREEE